jgi:HAD superfamily hydrolase (TIGR01662 family)
MNMHTSVTPKIFFLDRDGTINVDTDFVHKPEEWEFCPGAPQAIRRLNAAGFKVVVVTNQSGVIRKRFSMADVVKLHEHAARTSRRRKRPHRRVVRGSMAPQSARRPPSTATFRPQT